jgi:hypothetical protein
MEAPLGGLRVAIGTHIMRFRFANIGKYNSKCFRMIVLMND